MNHNKIKKIILLNRIFKIFFNRPWTGLKGLEQTFKIFLCCYCSVTKLCPTLCDPMDYSPPHQAPLSTGFFRQEYWSVLSFPSAGDLPRPGIKPMSPTLASRFFTTEPPGKPNIFFTTYDKKYICPYIYWIMNVLSCFSCVRLSVTLWTEACQARLSMGFSRQEY